VRNSARSLGSRHEARAILLDVAREPADRLGVDRDEPGLVALAGDPDEARVEVRVREREGDQLRHAQA